MTRSTITGGRSTGFRAGEVVLATFPFTDLSASKARPAVVISGSLYQAERPDLMLAALTTNVSNATGALDYILRDWGGAGLRFPTAFKPVVLTASPRLVVHRIGWLTPRDLAEVQDRLRRALEL